MIQSQRTWSEILDILQETRLVAVVRRLPGDAVSQVLKALVDGGLRVLEITVDSEGALQVIEDARKSFGKDILIGAGTVKTKEQVRDATRAGAEFLVSPHLDLTLLKEAQQLGRPFIPGVLTPSEIQTALNAGVEMVKVFPARTMGPGYVKDLLGPFGGLKIMVTGGIHDSTAASYIQAGAVAVGMGSSLFPKQDIENRDWAAISNRVAKILRTLS